MSMRLELCTLELLGDLVFGHGRHRIGDIGIQNISVGADFVAEDRTVADRAQELLASGIEFAQRLGAEEIVIADDEELSRMLEERFQIIDDDEVEIEEEGNALEIGKLAAEERKLLPAAILEPAGRPSSGRGKVSIPASRPSVLSVKQTKRCGRFRCLLTPR